MANDGAVDADGVVLHIIVPEDKPHLKEAAEHLAKLIQLARDGDRTAKKMLNFAANYAISGDAFRRIIDDKS